MWTDRVSKPGPLALEPDANCKMLSETGASFLILGQNQQKVPCTTTNFAARTAHTNYVW